MSWTRDQIGICYVSGEYQLGENICQQKTILVCVNFIRLSENVLSFFINWVTQPHKAGYFTRFRLGLI